MSSNPPPNPVGGGSSTSRRPSLTSIHRRRPSLTSGGGGIASSSSAASSPSASPRPPAPLSSAAAAAAASSPPLDPIPSPERPSSPDLPLTMSASMVLGALPRDATAALAAASGAAAAGGYGANDKVVVRWKAVAGAPPPPRPLAKISAGQRFDAVVAYLRRVLRVAETDSVFLYVNQAFAPALDEVVGNLHRCFKDSKDQLIIAYSITPAFG